MTPVTDITIWSEGTSDCLELETSGLAEYPERVRIEGGMGPDAHIALEAVESMLRNEPTALFGFIFPDPPWMVVALPRSDDHVAIDAQNDQEATVRTDVPPEGRRLDHPPVPVDKHALIEAIFRWAEPSESTPDGPTEFRAMYEEAQEVYEHYQRHGPLEDYEWAPDADQIEDAPVQHRPRCSLRASRACF